MAAFGANCPCFKAYEKDTGVVLGRLVQANLTVNNATGEIYADDELAEQVAEFASGSIALQTDDLGDTEASEIYGCTVTDGKVTYNKDDTAPEGVLAYFKAVMRRGKKYFKGYYYPRVRAAMGNDNAQTKGNSITFQPSNTTFTVMADDNGDWLENETFDTRAEAVAWCKEKCSVAAAAT